MTNPKNEKWNNTENKRNDVNRPEGKRNDKKNPPKFENFNGEVIK